MLKPRDLLLIFLFFPAACTIPPAEAPKSQLQVRAIQTREYDERDMKTVMKSLIDVLQDEGFMIKNADSNLGFISAQKEVDIERPGDAFFGGFGRPREIPRWRKSAQIEASINISEFGKTTRVRANFQRKELDNIGATVAVYAIDDERFFQYFFEKVDKGLFIQKEKI
ncbi:MAG: hypothetical protein GYA55_07755 [SAR324 cluster bacterium]|uniref:Uncharacterized protein n=1 Tax=SAR324 cluster bacterium TaxID=2024889 RepID=A0A7X9FSF3_9DELT|nr:hypothetical protein [SAR324 cluster bacterium]